MFYIGPAGYPIGSRNPVEAVEKVQEMGLNALEVQFVRQARMEEAKARSIGARARELGVLLSAHAPYYVNFNSMSRTTVRKSVEWVMKTARIGDMMGAWIIVIHAASYSGKSKKTATKAVVKGLKACSKIMEDEGLRPYLGLETMGRRASWGTLSEIKEVMEEVDRSVPVIDFGHLHARDGGRFKSVDDFRIALEEITSMYDGHLHCHFSCIEYTEAGEIRHLPLEAKEPDFSLLARAIRSFERSVTLISETPSPEKGAMQMRRILANR